MKLEKFTKRIIFLFPVYILIMLATSCDISKKALKNKTQTEQKNDIIKEGVTITKEKAQGGTVVSNIIPEKEREKDDNGFYKEIIQKLTEGGATQTVYYKPDGTVDVKCTADEIWRHIEARLTERDNSTTSTDSKVKESEKTENFDSTVILYAMLGFMFIVLILAFFGFKLLSKNTQALTTVLEKIK